MKIKKALFLFAVLNIACKKEIQEIISIEKPKPEQIVIISKYAFNEYRHYTNQDSIGSKDFSPNGSYTPVKSPSFSYFDNQNNVTFWNPKPNEIDTIVIPYDKEYLELSLRNSFTAIKNTYLLKNGDTLIFEYKNKLPIAQITNRKVNDLELNYNNYRLKTLFNNKYSSHLKTYKGIVIDYKNIDRSQPLKKIWIDYYAKSERDKENELTLLDSLYQSSFISKDNYNYRIAALNGLMESHKRNRFIRQWLEEQAQLKNSEQLNKLYGYDLSKTDSLMTFLFFRDYLQSITQYDLNFITVTRKGSGSKFIDSRIRFDSIIKDPRLNQSAKNFLLFETFQQINRNFSVKDKEKYFHQLKTETTNRNQLHQLAKDLNLNFELSDKLLMTSMANDTITFNEVLAKNKGKWLYLDFWASWCAPCRRTMPASNNLKKELQNENIEFIYLSLNDKKEPWKKAIVNDSIQNNQHYFIVNGNTSKVIEDLSINTIPHFLIYNPDGVLVNGYAERPGRGAKAQLKKLIHTK